jgi:hypothetical protein
MAVLSDYISGSISLTNGSVDFTGVGTGWLLAGFKEGDTIIDITGATEYMGVVATIDANGAGTLTKAWEGPTLADVAYRMRYQPDGARVSAQSRNLIEIMGNGNLQALAGLSGSANQVPMFTGPGAMTLVPKTDLVSGVAYDVQVDLLTDRDAYDGQAEGFSVLVADVGDGRAAVYAKASATSGDWSDPAYVTGPIGPLPEVTVGTVTTGDPGTSVIVTPTPTVDGVELDFTIPAGRGPVIEGDYNPATAYVLDDAVLYNGSTFIALGPTTGNAPPTLPTTSNAYWQLLARQGIDGAGTVNSVGAGAGISVDSSDPTAPVVSAPTLVAGPASVTNERLPVFDGTTGKLVKATPVSVDGTGNMAGLAALGLSGAIVQAGVNLKAIRHIGLIGSTSTVYSTSGQVLVSGQAQAYTALSATSSLLVIAQLQTEISRTGANGGVGSEVTLYRYNGTAYVAFGVLLGQELGSATVTGETIRNAVTLVGVLTAAEKRSDNPTQWAISSYFQSLYAGCLAAVYNHRFYVVEFEP